MSRYVNGIVACLYEYLNLSPDQVNFQKVRLRYMQVLLTSWNFVIHSLWNTVPGLLQLCKGFFGWQANNINIVTKKCCFN